jgi:hypothetical protein
MKSITKQLVACAVLWALAWPAQGFAQRGMGDTTGVAQQAVKPAIVSLSGAVREIVTGPCEQTTGRSYLGTHIVLTTDDGAEVNVHLGPAQRVDAMVEPLKVGTAVQVAGFRTEKMPENHYVAQVIKVGDETLRLRDDNLRPVWAGNRGAGNGAPGMGGGGGQGRGPLWGRGGMGGRGNGYGPGRGYGRGMGAGWRHGAGPGAGGGFVDDNHNGVCDWREMTRWDQ